MNWTRNSQRLLFLIVLSNCGSPSYKLSEYPVCTREATTTGNINVPKNTKPDEVEATGPWVCTIGDVVLVEPTSPEVIEKIVEVPVYIEGETIVIYRDRIVHVPQNCPKKRRCRGQLDDSSDDGSSDD